MEVGTGADPDALQRALKKFRTGAEKAGVILSMRRHEQFMKPGERRRLKQLRAAPPGREGAAPGAAGGDRLGLGSTSKSPQRRRRGQATSAAPFVCKITAHDCALLPMAMAAAAAMTLCKWASWTGLAT
jgi:ribosomal protein S21